MVRDSPKPVNFGLLFHHPSAWQFVNILAMIPQFLTWRVGPFAGNARLLHHAAVRPAADWACKGGVKCLIFPGVTCLVVVVMQEKGGGHMAYTLKRYANRKLYDPQKSRYVTLDEVAEMIRRGQEIVVTDVATGEDLTSVVLAQIIVETERQHRTALPTAFLHQLIQYGASWQDFVLQSLRANLQGVFTSQREVERIMREWARQCGWLPLGQPEAHARAGVEPPGDLAAMQQEVAVLREQLATLAARLEQRQTNAAPPPSIEVP
jgi:polyhydroxyalkanoate synthesis repressor PhaR